MEFDASKIQEEGYQIITPIVFTNTSKYLKVFNTRNSDMVDIGDKILVLET